MVELITGARSFNVKVETNINKVYHIFKNSLARYMKYFY